MVETSLLGRFNLVNVRTSLIKIIRDAGVQTMSVEPPAREWLDGAVPDSLARVTPE